MQYQGGLEQLVLYSIEEDLKRDAVRFAPCGTSMILNTEPIKRLAALSSTTSARLWRKRSKRLSTPNLRLLTG